MFDPMMIAQLLAGAAQNPQMMAGALASTGVAPGAALGQGVAPNITQPFDASQLGGVLGGGLGFQPPAVPPGAGPAGQPGGWQEALKAAGGAFKPTDNKPIMNAGVSGSQAAPKLELGGKGSLANDALLSMLMQGGRGAGAVPDLAQLLKGLG